MKYKVIVEETVSQAFDIEADSPEEAFRIAEHGYRDGALVLEPGNVIQVQAAVFNEAGDELVPYSEIE